jgi:isoleucyl-tRNA synthetase
MEEVWSHYQANHEDSILLHVWPVHDLSSMSDPQKTAMERVFKIRKALQIHLEELRNQGKIGSGLESSVTLSLPQGDLLWAWEKELKFIFIVSHVVLKEAAEESFDVEPFHHTKCPRCWHRVIQLEQEVCDRCVVNIEDRGERRYYA